MFEWHGWATVMASASIDDDEAADALQRQAEAAVVQIVADASGTSNEVTEIRRVNGLVVVVLAGCHNHRGSAPVELFQSIAEIAPGSYGLLHTIDHNHPSEPWERWVMRRGTVTREIEQSLTPHIGNVEDPGQ